MANCWQGHNRVAVEFISEPKRSRDLRHAFALSENPNGIPSQSPQNIPNRNAAALTK